MVGVLAALAAGVDADDVSVGVELGGELAGAAGWSIEPPRLGFFVGGCTLAGSVGAERVVDKIVAGGCGDWAASAAVLELPFGCGVSMAV